MKFDKSFILWLLMIGVVQNVSADLVIKASEPERFAKKTIIKLSLENKFSNSIESARAVVFLLNEKGEVVGQNAQWIIGGSKDKPGLASSAKRTFHVVVTADKPFGRTKVLVTRLVLDGGRLANPNNEVRIEMEKPKSKER